MPIVFSTSSLPLPSTVARFMGLAALKKAAVALNPRAFGTNILEVARPERRRRWSRKEVLQYTCYASVRFAMVQAIGQVLYLCPYVKDLSTEWTLSSVTTLMLGSVFTTCNGERISDLNIGSRKENSSQLCLKIHQQKWGPSKICQTIGKVLYLGRWMCGLCCHHFILCPLSPWYRICSARKPEGKFPSIMPQDIPAEVDAFKNLLTYPSGSLSGDAIHFPV